MYFSSGIHTNAAVGDAGDSCRQTLAAAPRVGALCGAAQDIVAQCISVVAFTPRVGSGAL